MHWLLSLGLAAFGSLLLAGGVIIIAGVRQAPTGFEDGNAFHYGAEPPIDAHRAA